MRAVAAVFLAQALLVAAITKVDRAPAGPGPANDPVSAAVSSYMTNPQLQAYLRDFAVRCSSISRLFSIGRSANTFPLYALEISDRPGRLEPEPNVKMVANIHGDETLGRTLTVGLAEWLCQNYPANATAKRIVDGMHLYLVPTLNPDGFAAQTRWNARGFDLNRNFPDQFINPSCKKAGTGAEEPETLAMMRWSLETRFSASLAFHGGALVASYPWDGTKSEATSYNPAPDDRTFKYLARTYAKAHATMARRNSEFPSGITNGAAWYSLYGGMQDWMYLCTDALEITVEVGTKWPAESSLRRLFADNLPAMLAWVQRAGLGGVRGTVLAQVEVGGSFTTVPAIDAKVLVRGMNKTTLTGPVYGEYHRPLAPGKYTIEVHKAGYKSAAAEVLVPLSGRGVVHDFVLAPKTRRRRLGGEAPGPPP